MMHFNDVPFTSRRTPSRVSCLHRPNLPESPPGGKRRRSMHPSARIPRSYQCPPIHFLHLNKLLRSYVTILFAWLCTGAVAQVTYCPTCPGVYQGQIIDLHFHLPLAACKTGDCIDCDLPVQQLNANGLLGDNGELNRLGIQFAMLEGSANDNVYPTGSYNCVFHPNRDTERRLISDSSAGILFSMLDGFKPDEEDAGGYVHDKLAAGGWKGIGEVHLRSAVYNTAWDATIPEMADVYEEAAAKNVPVLIHFEPAFPDGPYADHVEQLRTVLNAHPSVRIVWFHHWLQDCTTPNQLWVS